MKRKSFSTSIIALCLIISFSKYLNAQTISVDKVYNIGPPINTGDADFAPTFTSDGKTMVFNSKRGQRYQDIYISRLQEDGKWSAPRRLGELNSPYIDENPFITPDGEYILFSSDRDGSFEMPANDDGRIRVSFDIYISKKINGGWDAPIKLPGKVNTAHHERTPSLGSDLSLYYTSMPFGDISKAKIMKADYRDGEFVNPVEMPYPVNDKSQNIVLVPSPDGKGFFFSSNREGGYGGWDIYYVKYDDGIFSDPVNLGNKINSGYNETNLSLTGDSIYFCSDREGGYGSFDIYTSKITVEDYSFKIITIDKKTKQPVESEVKIKARVKESDELTHTYELKKKTDENGKAAVKYDPAIKELDVNVTKEGYLPLFDKIDIPSLNGNPVILELIPVEKEASFDIRSIYFDFESAVIKKESFPYLDALAGYLKDHPTMRFEIIGHTDLHGSDEFNDKLSVERADSVKDYLAGKGLDEKRFTTRGMGKRKPVINEISPEADEKNRRTEFRLIEK